MSDTVPTPDATAHAETPTTPQFQSIACRKAMPDDAQQDPPKVGYATPEAAAMRCKELGHDVSDMEEHEDAYVFHQKAAPECKDAGEPEITDVEDGMKGIGCGKDAEVAPGVTDEQNPYEKVPEVGKPGLKGKKVTTKAGTGISGGGERAAIEGGNAEEAPRIPAGAQFVKDYCGLHDQGQAIHAEHKGMLENPPIAEASDRWAEEDAERGEEMNGMIGELYPEVSFPDAPVATGVDDVGTINPLLGKRVKRRKGTSSDVRSPTRTSTSTEAYTADNFTATVTGGAGEGDTSVTITPTDPDDPDNAGGLGTSSVGMGKPPVAKDGEESTDAPPDEMTLADNPTEDDDMPYTAKYLQKVAGHIDTGQAMLNNGLKKQESPPVKDFAAEELDRLEKRKSECKDLMESEHPDHVTKVFPEGESATEEPAEEPEKKEDEPKPDPEENPDVETPDAKVDEKKPKEEDKNKKAAPKAAKKAAPATNADLLREVVKGLNQLTAAVAAKGTATVAKAAPTPEPTIDPETAQQLAALQAENRKLQKEVAALVTHEKRFQEKLASRMGVNGKKKSACKCNGTCGTCKGYFSAPAPTKDMGVTDESAGGALVPPPETPEETKTGAGYHGPYTAQQIPGGTSWLVNDATGSNVAGPFASKPEADSAAKRWEETMSKSLEPKKSYRLAATFKGQPILLPPGRPVPVFASDFRIEDEDGALFDNRVWQEFEPAEAMLMQLAK
jgi:outer membrane biosynthesis protein TonB